MADVQRNSLSEEALERIKFSFSSKNAENVVAPCLVQVYVSEDHSGPITWRLVTTGVVALLRNRESTKKGWVWNISVAIADRFHGMCVWRDKLTKESSYTIMSDNFHVFAVSDIQAITGFVFESAEDGHKFGDTYRQWVRDKLRDDGHKGKIQSGPRFRREMISRPCNFQHISGSAALAQIQQMEDAKQAVGRVISTIGPRRAVSLDCIDSDSSGGKHKRKDILQTEWPSKYENANIPMPAQTSDSGLDLMYSQEPGSTRDSTPSVPEPQTNGIHYNNNVQSSSIVHPQYYSGQQQQQTLDQQVHYKQDQDELVHHNHQQDQDDHNTSQAAAQGMTYEVEDIGYDYDDGMSEPTEDVWRESVMEGTNWEDEILKAWSLRTGNTEFTTTGYM